MKRYLLFHGTHYYPSGGWEDFHDSYDSVADAEAEIKTRKAEEYFWDWHHIVDSVEGKIVEQQT